MTNAPKSKRGADRQYAAIYRRLRQESGYQPFGFDWVTLRLTRPDEYAQLKALRAMYETLPY